MTVSWRNKTNTNRNFIIFTPNKYKNNKLGELVLP